MRLVCCLYRRTVGLHHRNRQLMKRAAPSLILLASLALFVGWTQNNQSDWLKGIIYAGSGKVQLTDATGNLMSAGNFTSTGSVAIGGTLAVTGATTLRSTLSVTGAQTNASTLGVVGAVSVTGATLLRSTLGVSGAVALSSTLAVGGSLTAPTGTFTGPVSTSGTLTAADAATFADEFSLTDISDAATAGTGGQGAVPLTVTVARFATVTGSNDTTLPGAAAGLCVMVGNGNGSTALDVFPASGDQINKESANTAVALAAGESMFCCASNTTNWVCVIGSAN